MRCATTTVCAATFTAIPTKWTSPWPGEVISLLDHAMVLNAKNDPRLIDVLKQNFDKIVVVEFQPTTENLLDFIAGKIKQRLPETVKLCRVRLRETDTSYADWEE